MALSSANLNANRDLGNLFRFVNNTYSEVTLSDYFTDGLAHVLNVCFTPVLIFVGIIGNLLSVSVFFKSKLRGQSTSQYLSALAISDTIFLMQLAPPWLKAVQASHVFARDGFCQIFMYCTYVCSAISSWLVVAFTIERFVAVLYPLRRNRMCTVRRARFIIVAIATCCIAINLPVLKFAVPRGNDCNIDYELMKHAARFNVVDTISTFTLPLTIIMVLNICIVVGVCKLSRARSQLQETLARPRCARRRHPHPARARTSLHRSQQRITKMLLVVSTVFVVLNLPAYSMRIAAYANNMKSNEYSGRWAAVQQISLLCSYANFGINFFLYCMTGQNFRRALGQTFPCFKRLKNAIKSLVCSECSGCVSENGVPPNASVTNSLSINTEASSHAAASGVSLNQHNINEVAASSSTCRHGIGAGYLREWRFTSIRNQPEDQFELPVYPNRGSPSRPRALPRPVPLRLDRFIPNLNMAENLNSAEATNIGFRTQTMRSIPFLPIPGEIAPLGADSMPPTPSLNPSPSPPPSPPLSPPLPRTRFPNASTVTTTFIPLPLDGLGVFLPRPIDHEAHIPAIHPYPTGSSLSRLSMSARNLTRLRRSPSVRSGLLCPERRHIMPSARYRSRSQPAPVRRPIPLGLILRHRSAPLLTVI